VIDIGLNRTSPDFSPRDRRVLNVLRPYLVQGYRNAERFARSERILALVLQGADAALGGMVVVGGDGRIRRASPEALRRLAAYSGRPVVEGGPVPDAVGRWLRQHDAALTRIGHPAALHPLVIDRHDRRLVVRVLLRAGARVLILHEERLAGAPAALRALGLGRREAEVLCWVAQGKTDAEVARLLGLSPRTVGKHLERIYQSRGVENRTAAAARAWEAERTHASGATVGLTT
jgi:DNA-binding CsgD family transcriptional regulator